MKILISQRVPALFRKPFFEKLGSFNGLEVSVFSGQPRKKDGIKCLSKLSHCKLILHENIYFLFGSFWIQKKWREVIQKENPDVLIISPTPRMISNFFMLSYMQKRGRKVIGWGMGQMPGLSKFKAKIHSILARVLVRKLDGMICYSTVAKEYYSSLGLKNDCIYIAHNSTDTVETDENINILSQSPNWREHFNTKWQLDGKKARVLFVGRLVPSKKVDKLIDVIKTIDIPLELIIVGDGTSREFLESFTCNKNQKILFAGHQNGLELAKFFISADMFILPSLGGLAIHQAMSYGLPVIASIGDGTEKDLIKHGVNGYLFEKDNFDELKDQIQLMLGREHDTKIMGANSRKIINEHFTISKMTENFINAIEQTF